MAKRITAESEGWQGKDAKPSSKAFLPKNWVVLVTRSIDSLYLSPLYRFFVLVSACPNLKKKKKERKRRRRAIRNRIYVIIYVEKEKEGRRSSYFRSPFNLFDKYIFYLFFLALHLASFFLPRGSIPRYLFLFEVKKLGEEVECAFSVCWPRYPGMLMRKKSVATSRFFPTEETTHIGIRRFPVLLINPCTVPRIGIFTGKNSIRPSAL